MADYRVPAVLRQSRGLALPAVPAPSRFLRHAEHIDPTAEAYATLYHARHGFPVRAEALERFFEVDLQLPYGWEEIVEPEGARILAQHDLASGAINPNARYADFFEENPHFLASALLHELGHIALRHGELYTDGSSLPLPGMALPRPFLHRTDWLPWGISQDLLKRAVKVALVDQRVRNLLKPERFEPDWVYSQAQRFAAAFMIPHERLLGHVRQMRDLAGWDSVYELARRFATSPAMMRYRLEQLGYITVQGREITPGIRLRQQPLF